MPPKRSAAVANAKKEKKENESCSESGTESGSESESEEDDEDEKGPEPKKADVAASTSPSEPIADSPTTSAPAASRPPQAVLKNDKANMVFPKGTFVIRLSDLDQPDLNWLWRIDNHQLLQKYFVIDDHPENDGPRQWYEKSNRYTGWFCTEKWKFLEVKVVKREGKDEKVKVVYPSEEKRAKAKKDYDEEEKHEVDDD